MDSRDKNNTLFKLGNRFLSWFCDPELLPEIEGDLFEMYQRWVVQYGARKARWLYFWNVITFLQLRNYSRQTSRYDFNPNAMLRNNLLIAFRNLLRNKTVTSINVLGLAMGMSLCLIILMVLKDQYNYDTFHPYPERTYRITTKVQQPDGTIHYASTPLPVAEVIQHHTSFIDHTVSIYPSTEVRYAEVSDGKKELPVNGTFVSESFFSVFGFQLASGNPQWALAEPYTVVLNRATAERFFRDQNPVGQVLTIGNLGEFTITGVMEEPPVKSHFPYEMYVSMATVPSLEHSKKLSSSLNEWGYYDAAYTFTLLKAGTDQNMLEKALLPIAAQALQTFNFNRNETAYTFAVQPLSDIVPYKLTNEPLGDVMSVQGLAVISGIAFIILLIAGFNYINLSIAHAMRRTQEVGIRKVSGALSHQIFSQFMVESVLFALLALGLAYGFVYFIPIDRLQRQIAQIEPDVTLWLWFVGFSVLVGLLAGSLPAWMFARLTALHSLSSKRNPSLFRGLALRKGLLVLQFTVSLVFIIVLLVQYRQSEYNATADYGFEQDNLLTIPLQKTDYQSLAHALENHTQVTQITATSENFGLQFGKQMDLKKEKEEDSRKVFTYSVDPAFIPTMGLQMIAGNNFPENLSPDETFIILNERALAPLNLGTAEEAVGQMLWLNDSVSTQVLGVLKDFNFMSRKHPIYPLALQYQPDEFQYLNIKVRDIQSASLLNHLKSSWHELHPDQPLEYFVFKEKFYEYNSYNSDVKNISSIALMAIVISCLGLLGVVMYSVKSRVKEIGIRKVIGASTARITLMLSRDFLMLLMLAALIATPMGYWIGRLTLAKFVYKVPVDIGVLAVGIGILLLVGLATIASQTIRAALANPVDSLRNE